MVCGLALITSHSDFMIYENNIIASVKSSDGISFQSYVEVVIVGAGACGLTAALAAKEKTDDIIILERDATPTGSTSLSSGFIPAAGTMAQKEKGISDSAKAFEEDISKKANGKQDKELANIVAYQCGKVLDWLSLKHDINWYVLDNFLYPGHAFHRMHAVKEKTGLGLINRLQAASEREGISLSTNCLVDTIFMCDDLVKGLRITRPNGMHEFIECGNLILACNGYGANKELVRKYIPEMSDALYFGHSGNQGHAVLWGEQLNAKIKHMSGYQGHGSVATPHGILITWALMMEGGIQVNQKGYRFSNENEGYSEQSVHVLAQPGQVAWVIYDEKLHALGKEFPDYNEALNSGAIKSAKNASDLADTLGIDRVGFVKTLYDLKCYTKKEKVDPFGRDFKRELIAEKQLYGIQVTGALFHTQGGLMVNHKAQVLKSDGTHINNLFAGGGAACGVSGPDVSGYLSGNGLLTALALGWLAGQNVLIK